MARFNNNYGRARRPPRRNTSARFVIEQGGRGATYRHTEGYTVYKLDFYPANSVLSGQQRRTFIDRYKTLEEALQAYPQAEPVPGTTYQPPDLSHLPDDTDY